MYIIIMHIIWKLRFKVESEIFENQQVQGKGIILSTSYAYIFNYIL